MAAALGAPSAGDLSCAIALGDEVTGGSSLGVPFEAHIVLFETWLARREPVVVAIQGLLDAERQSLQWRQDRAALSKAVDDAFHAVDLDAGQLQLRGQLQLAHWDGGFRPHVMQGVHNDLADPGEMMVRAFALWRLGGWPGAEIRLRHAHALFNLYLLRVLELLVMRIWDAGAEGAGSRLAEVQRLLDALWRSSPADQPVLVRDARWLIPVAQSPTTLELSPYFDIAARVEQMPEADRLEIQKAAVVLAGGHLRSQLRYYHLRGASLDEESLVLTSRRSNALDFAMTIEGLVVLLRGYEAAVQAADPVRRTELAGAILQGISPDPDMFVNRVELLGPYSMIELLFTTSGVEGEAGYTPRGLRHIALLKEYATRIGRAAAFLQQDCPQFRPEPGRYSPLGVMFGFASNIAEHMALKTISAEADQGFSLEDAFVDGTAGDGRLEWVDGWRRLPQVSEEALRQYAYPQGFAEEIHARIEAALARRVAAGAGHAVEGRLRVFASGDAADTRDTPALASRHFLSTDRQMVASYRAQACDPANFEHDRQEGEFAVSYQGAGGWTALTKDFLTTELEAGRDARVSGLPPKAAAILRLMCPGLVA